MGTQSFLLNGVFVLDKHFGSGRLGQFLVFYQKKIFKMCIKHRRLTTEEVPAVCTIEGKGFE